MFIDSHCHPTADQFQNDLEQVIERARAEGVSQAIISGITLQSCEQALSLHERYPDYFYVGVSVHPTEAVDEWNHATLLALESLALRPGVVAIGETGLDYYWTSDPLGQGLQKEAFWAHLDLADRLNLPVIIHNREATGAILQLIKDHGPPKAGGVMHCFNGTIDDAGASLELGFYLSFAGNLTYKNAQSLREVAGWAPLDRLLIETDSPYLPPVPYRGQRNEMGYVKLVAQQIAEVKGMPVAQVAEATTANARRLFRIPA